MSKKFKKKGRISYNWAFILIMAFAGSFVLYSCHEKHADKQQETGAYYTCPMHHQVHSDKPGKCPVCGMTLIKVVPGHQQSIPVDSALSYLVRPVNEVVAGNYKVISPEELHFHDTINTYGHIGFDERDVNTVSTLVAGRIEKSYVKYANQHIVKGQPLMKIYSPQLLSAQRDLQQAVKDNDSSLVAILRTQLSNLGMSDDEVQQVVDGGSIASYITIRSPYDGISVNLPPDIREGMYVSAGQTVFTIRNISRTWAILNVFDEDIGKIHPGDKVLLSADADSPRTIEGTVSFIPPYRDGNEKTTSVRVYLPNIWKIGTFIRGQVITERKASGLVVPASAVTRLGMHAVVWMQNDKNTDIFEKRNVQIGEEINNQIVILAGINRGDKIAKNAAYMVDSDSFIQ